ncbi:microtubule-associated tyrosine carboxypeptidase 1-like [Asterias amurensis]|uniref:microtubule-associated tyrosine carboxypeptidase 1-like n=1 Tax=Asterias amurensis TaxID=7602 RepID=UPI003AB61826
MKTKPKKSKNKSAQSMNKVVIRNYDETPMKFRSKIDPLNLEEHKLEFLQHGHISQFQFKTFHDDSTGSKDGQIKFDLLPEATRILEMVREEFGCGDRYIEQAFGPRIEVEEASNLITSYLKESGSEGMMTVSWSKDLSCSGQMCWHGPSLRYNRPEARKYFMWIKNSKDNLYLREHGIRCLANHEIATHFYRSLNDGLQPWFSHRQRFGLGSLSSYTLTESEEGLASINTMLEANQKYLYFQALTYYVACKATELTFQELFDHLGQYVVDQELRWKYVMRVKRCLQDPGSVGGYGKDQCYFAGAVDILRNIDTTDFHLMYAGKISREEIPRIKRLARLDFIKLPIFLQNMESYRKQLRHIAVVNGLIQIKSVGKSSQKSSQMSKFGKKKVPRPPSAMSHSLRENSDKDVRCASQTSSRYTPSSRHSTKTKSNTKHANKSSSCRTKKQPSQRSVSPLSESESKTVVKMIYITKEDKKEKDKKLSWWSSRSPSPVNGNVPSEDRMTAVSPVPYSPHRWLLRRRNRTSPNTLGKVNETKDNARSTSQHPLIKI